MSDKIILEILKVIPALKDVPEEQLQWLIKNGKIISLRKDDPLFDRNSPLNFLYIILSGNLMLKSEQAESFRAVGKLQKGSVTGSLPYSRAKEAAYHAIALQSSKILALHKKHFPEMIKTQCRLTEAFVHFMSTRVREFTKWQQQNEKMMALGKLSAGLAHELNNPSAAVIRSSQKLKDNLISSQKKFQQVVKLKLTNDQINHITFTFFSQLKDSNSAEFSMADRVEKEEELLEWLDKNQIENSEEIAENFVEYNLSLENFQQIFKQLPAAYLSPIINWFNHTILMDRLVGEINDAAQKINDLVLSIKTYTHMDQSPEKQQGDIHSGINNTLKIMHHKIRKMDVVVKKDFQQDLPQPQLKITEFNQVWTNLIDNAIDALENAEQKILKIKTRRDGDYIKVSITDTGSGIPAEHKEKIFDPFFTTKAVDKGTGLGLDMVKQVVQQHNGSITVNSNPGETEFEICIPIK